METSEISSVRAVLEGGPETIPSTERTQLVGVLDDKIKLAHLGGYEHFERIDGLTESAPAESPVFHWTMRTEIAE